MPDALIESSIKRSGNTHMFARPTEYALDNGHLSLPPDRLVLGRQKVHEQQLAHQLEYRRIGVGELPLELGQEVISTLVRPHHETVMQFVEPSPRPDLLAGYEERIVVQESGVGSNSGHLVQLGTLRSAGHWCCSSVSHSQSGRSPSIIKNESTRGLGQSWSYARQGNDRHSVRTSVAVSSAVEDDKPGETGCSLEGDPFPESQHPCGCSVDRGGAAEFRFCRDPSTVGSFDHCVGFESVRVPVVAHGGITCLGDDAQIADGHGSNTKPKSARIIQITLRGSTG